MTAALPLLLLLLALAQLLSLSAVAEARVPVYAMVPLTAVSPNGVLDGNLEGQLKTLAAQGADGVVVDVWWGVVERGAPRQYDWGAYQSMFAACAKLGLEVNAIMSFHQCGGNVGDDCNIPLPGWAKQDPDNFYKDREGTVDYEYLSLAAEETAQIAGRTPLQIYKDYFDSFRDKALLAGTVTSVEISLGPAGELRYPAYKQGTYPGVGEFQCYDRHFLAKLASAAAAAGHPEYGRTGPDDAGSYHQQPDQTGFWSVGSRDNWESEYGRFFLGFYAQQLVDHADRVLGLARASFGSSKVGVWAKIAGIHWQYKTPQHAAECTAGYYNTNDNNGYTAIAQVLAKHGVGFAFTCMEMFDSDQCATCGPQELVQQTHGAAIAANIAYSGENALPIFDQRHYSQILYQARTPREIAFFGYLRMSSGLFYGPNLQTFRNFVADMHNE